MGYDEETFWRITPKMFFIYKEAAEKRAEIEMENKIYAAWVSGLVARSDKPIHIEDLIPRLKEGRVIDDEALLIEELKRYSACLPTSKPE